MKLCMYFPIEWDFGEYPTDGLYGSKVEGAGVIYVYDCDDESETFEKVLLKTTLKELVEDFIDGSASLSSGMIDDPEHINIARRIQAVFMDEIERIEESICK